VKRERCASRHRGIARITRITRITRMHALRSRERVACSYDVKDATPKQIVTRASF
jgi:hypothetical protein